MADDLDPRDQMILELQKRVEYLEEYIHKIHAWSKQFKQYVSGLVQR